MRRLLNASTHRCFGKGTAVLFWNSDRAVDKGNQPSILDRALWQLDVLPCRLLKAESLQPYPLASTLEGDTVNWTALIVQLISGAAGGNIVGAIAKKLSLGPVGNSIAGIVGGGIGGQLLGALMGGGAAAAPAAGGFDIGSLVAQIGGGGIGGAILMAIVGAIRNAMANKTA
jgi:hypothetical protein